MEYFKFIIEPKEKEDSKNSFLYNILDKLLSASIPKANPDFDEKYNQISMWYIEYDITNDYVNREIGLDNKERLIVKGPYKGNLGFWTDTDLKLDNFKKWNIEIISSEIFNELWEKDLI